MGYAGFGPGGPPPPRGMPGPTMGMPGSFMQEQVTTTQVLLIIHIFSAYLTEYLSRLQSQMNLLEQLLARVGNVSIG